MKLGVISDIHSNAVALERVLNFLDNKDINEIYCSGDLVGYYTQPNIVVEKIRENSITSVLGNHDKGILGTTPEEFNYYAHRALDWNRRKMSNENINFISSLPKETWEKEGGKEIHMVHGSPALPIDGYVFEDQVDSGFLKYCYSDPPDILIHGHTHKPYVKQVNNTLVVNPGSVGQPRDGDSRASCGIINLEANDVSINRIPYNIGKVRNQVCEYLPIELADRLEKGR